MAWQRSPRVVSEVVDGQAVLVDPRGEELLTLNEVGTLVWLALDGQRGPAELAADLADRFDDVPVETVARDIAAFLDEVEAAGLVVPGDGIAG
ncbi:MAG: PqqD family protein [Actinomycetota bacterium]